VPQRLPTTSPCRLRHENGTPNALQTSGPPPFQIEPVRVARNGQLECVVGVIAPTVAINQLPSRSPVLGVSFSFDGEGVLALGNFGIVCLAGLQSLKITGTGYCFRFDGGRWLSAIRLCVSGRPTALTAGPRFTPVQPFPAVKRICVPRAGPARRSMLPFTIAKHVGARPRPVVPPGGLGTAPDVNRNRFPNLAPVAEIQ
jgi:hypothetical protein